LPCVFAIVATFSARLIAADEAAAKKPNILFIMTDQHRWDCIGANGNRLIKRASDSVSEEDFSPPFHFSRHH